MIGSYFALTDDMGRVSMFAAGVSEDHYFLSPDSQFLASDWHVPIFHENGIVIDPLTQVPKAQSHFILIYASDLPIYKFVTRHFR